MERPGSGALSPLVGASSSLHTALELGVPCLEHGLDPLEQSLPLPGPLILEPSDPPALGWGAEVKEGRLGVLPHREVNAWSKRSMNSIPILPCIPPSKGESTFGVHSSLRRESWVYPQGISSPEPLPPAAIFYMPLWVFLANYPIKIFPALSVIPGRTGDISDR